ncbi:MAG: hypothetical protein MZV63_23455 [Marinilabiliales bacterium]|nr:hypothetical protein [Marinilabiliales bacterium]
MLPAVYWVQQISSDGFTPYANVAGLDGPGADADAWNEVHEQILGRTRL